MAERVVLDLVANIDPIKEALAKLPPEMRKHASGAVRELERELRKAEKTANVVAAKTTHAFKQTGESAEGVKRIFDAVGGEAGTLAGQVEHVVRSMSTLSTTIGTAAGAATALTLGIGALGTAVIAAALNTSELVKQLEDSGDASPITREQLENVKDMDRSIALLKREFTEFAIILGADVAPAISSIIARFREGRKVALEWAYTARAVGTLGSSVVWEWLSENIGNVTDAFYENGEAADVNTDYMADLLAIYDELEVTSDDLAMKKDKLSAASKRVSDAHRAEMDAARQAADATKEIESIYLAAADTQVSAEQRIIDAHDRRIAKIGEAVNRGGDQMSAAAARAASEAQMLAELSDLYEQQEAERLAAVQRLREAAERMREEERAAAQRAIEDAKAEARAKQDIAFAAASNIAGSIASLAQMQADAYEDGTEQQKKAARRAFAVSQALGTVQAVISTAAGVARAFQDVPYPYSIAAAASVAATGAVQIATIASQTPNFATGGIMEHDHRAAMLQPGEGVLTRAGVENAGGASGVAALNQGRQGQSPIMAVVQFDHRWFDRGARQNIQRNGSIRRAITSRYGPIGQTEYVK